MVKVIFAIPKSMAITWPLLGVKTGAISINQLILTCIIPFWCCFDHSRPLEALHTTLSANQHCPEQFDTLIGQVEKLNQDFLEFEKECEAKTELCQFLGVWLKLVAVIKNVVVSEREGNRNLHAATVEDSMPIFAECDCTNYLQHGSWYLEQIKVLDFTYPELYRRFSIGQWVVQDCQGWFCAVGGDMKVEQTIQRVSKGPGGHYAVGATRNVNAVTEFELLFHEIGSITNILNFLTTNHTMKHTECHLQHVLSTTRRLIFNQNVAKLLDFVLERRYLIMMYSQHLPCSTVTFLLRPTSQNF